MRGSAQEKVIVHREKETKTTCLHISVTDSRERSGEDQNEEDEILLFREKTGRGIVKWKREVRPKETAISGLLLKKKYVKKDFGALAVLPSYVEARATKRTLRERRLWKGKKRTKKGTRHSRGSKKKNDLGGWILLRSSKGRVQNKR